MEKTQIIKYLHHPENLNQESLEQTKALTIDFPWFQTGWMLYLKNLKKINSPEFENVLKKVAVMVPDRKRLYKFLNNEISFEMTGEINLQENNLYRLEDEKIYTDGDSLIDRFLRSDHHGFKREPGVVKSVETLEEKPVIEKSVSEDEELVTETLANIYFSQKNYDKALSAYKKLSLKYPEKSIYFASRIKEIEVIKNNN